MAEEATAIQDWRQLEVPVGVTGGPDSEQERVTVTVIDTNELAKRNAGFADGGSFADLRLMPSGSLTVISCVDPRVDPSDVLGLKLGEAAVIRNVGGRVTPATLRTLGMLSKVVQARTGGPGPGDNH
ncbi:carbonic anhydrase [Streptomyces lydicus]|uniref:carbonic anhydrase n=1 Tax=Streptomyces lydicus TaxID=47763 RepID=UPI003407ADA8